MPIPNLIRLFERYDIKTENQLEELLEKENGGGSWSSEWGAGEGPRSFGSSIVYAMRGRLDHRDLLSDREYGIQHFTYIGSERILEESIKKGLFVSRRINFITDHNFHIHHSYIDYDNESRIGYYDDYHWSFSPDFVRDSFKYQEYIKSGKLQIIPSEVVSSRGEGFQIETSTTSEITNISKDIRELSSSNTVSSFGSRRLVDKILVHFRQNNQLANTMEMDIPWIEGIELKSLYQFISDHRENIDNFQKAYHKSLEEAINNFGDLNFSRLTKEINNDVILPEIIRIKRKYKRSLSHHKSLIIGGAFVATMPVTVALVGHLAFNQSLQSSDVAGLISGVSSGLVATLASNTIHYRNAKAGLEEENFYVLWKLSNKK